MGRHYIAGARRGKPPVRDPAALPLRDGAARV
jgi:hypothetical protein